MSAVTGISGIQLSAASAAYAPTNSADVSAIASAYQVVSSLGGNNSYVTSINSKYISATHAFYAEFAKKVRTGDDATSTAYISSLVGIDSATCSAIASSYAESAASSKQDTLSFGYDDDKISAINGSALAGQGGGSVVSPRGTILVNGSSIEGTNSAVLTANGGGFQTFLSPAYEYIATFMQTLSYDNVPDTGCNLLVTLAYTANQDTRVILSGRDLDYDYASASGFVNLGDATASIPMDGITGDLSASAESWLNLSPGVPFTAQKDGGVVVTGVGELAWKSAVDGVTNTVATNSASWGQGGVSSATVSAIASSYAESAASSKLDTTAFNSADFYSTSNPSGFIDSAYVDSAVSGKADSSALSSYVPYSSLEYNTASAISGINGSALAAGSTYSAGEGIDITDDVISVEAPVDIVAGPGIVIDNPDGNTLRVSTEADAETVLYDAGDSPSQTGPWQISEARTNFEWLDIVFGNDSTGSMKQVTRFAADSDYMKLHLPRYDEEPSYKWSTMTLSWNNTTASIKTNSVGRFTIASNGSVSVSTAAAQAPYLFQILGIHRINGGN